MKRGDHMIVLGLEMVAQQHHKFLGKYERLSLMMQMIECADIKIRGSCSRGATLKASL